MDIQNRRHQLDQRLALACAEAVTRDVSAGRRHGGCKRNTHLIGKQDDFLCTTLLRLVVSGHILRMRWLRCQLHAA